MILTSEGLGLGWLPDYPDFRDHTPHKGVAPTGETRDVPALLAQMKVAEPLAAVPASVDLRAGFSALFHASSRCRPAGC